VACLRQDEHIPCHL